MGKFKGLIPLAVQVNFSNLNGVATISFYRRIHIYRIQITSSPATNSAYQINGDEGMQWSTGVNNAIYFSDFVGVNCTLKNLKNAVYLNRQSLADYVGFPFPWRTRTLTIEPINSTGSVVFQLMYSL